MKKPTPEEIQSEIAKLKEMKPRVLRTSMFGDDHHANIDGQIDVLEKGLTEDEVYSEFEDSPDNVRDGAREAAMWLEGESEDGAPSENWKSLVR